MFIDEGFGSLDAQSLDNVIRALNNLSDGCHRLVGIISHIEALEESIPAQIDVIKKRDGSEINIKP
jgi:DNA repair protein SbcC/Rad50